MKKKLTWVQLESAVVVTVVDVETLFEHCDCCIVATATLILLDEDNEDDDDDGGGCCGCSECEFCCCCCCVDELGTSIIVADVTLL